MYNFYCYNSEKKIIISDIPVEKIRAKYGYKYEIVNKVKDKESIAIIKARIERQYINYSFIEWFQKEKKAHSEETKRKMSEAKLGKPRDEATRQKIAAGLKGRSNFQGKKHSSETKELMAEKKIGNQHTKDSYWAYDPRTDKETRVKDRNKLPPGFILGRDYDSIETGLYHIDEHRKLRLFNNSR